MKLGVCTSFDNIEIAAKAGFDYIEIALVNLYNMPEKEYQELLKKSADFPIPVLKCCNFLPGTVPVVGPDRDDEKVRTYLDKALSRAHALGIKTTVFGSGGSRRVPEGWSYREAWKQIVSFLQMANEYAEKYDMEIAIEPLRREECNILNLVSEAVAVAAVVDLPHIGTLGDSFHMLSCHEPWSNLKTAGDSLKHFHISHALPDLSGRIYPAQGDGSDYVEILRTLKEMDYRGTISVEASAKDFEAECEAALQCLHKALLLAGWEC